MQVTIASLFMVVAGGWSGAPQMSPHAQGYWQPGGYENRIGSPYFYSVPTYRVMVAPPSHAMTHDPGHKPCPCHAPSHAAHLRPTVVTTYSHHGTYGHAGFVQRVHDPYSYHFGPGFYRHYEHGHFRFPSYSYRRPWFHPGQPTFNRDTNFAW